MRCKDAVSRPHESVGTRTGSATRPRKGMGITAGICEDGCCGAASSDYRQSVAAGINRGVVFQPCRDITTASRLVSRDCDAGSRRHLEERQLRPRPSDWRTACRQRAFSIRMMLTRAPWLPPRTWKCVASSPTANATWPPPDRVRCGIDGCNA